MVADVRMEMNPNFEHEIGAAIVAKANEAVTAVGPPAGRDADAIEHALASELRARGISLPGEPLRKAAESIAAGDPFEFR